MIDIESVEVSTEEEGITKEDLDNLLFLFTVLEGSIPMNRSAGLNSEVLGESLEEAKNLYIINVIKKVNDYNNNFEVEDITFEEDMKNGKLKPKVVISYND